MKIVALEMKSIGNDVDMAEFQALGDFVCYASTSEKDIEERAKDADVIIVNKLSVNEETIGMLEKLKLVCITATGYDNIDAAYCKSRGISVCNVRGYSTESVVQHTFALYFYMSNKLRYYEDYVKSGEYVRSNLFSHFENSFYELAGKTWGIVGLGAIGRRVAEIAKAFGCDVIYYSTSGKNHNADYPSVNFEELLSSADMISIHAPLNERTRRLFQKEAFDKMKSSAYLINVGRGAILDDEALVEALRTGKIAGAALDVFEAEPLPAEGPLFAARDMENLVLTPHMAWGTVEARRRLMHEVFLNIKAFQWKEKRNVIC